MRLTKEREAEIRAAMDRAECVYVGRCNSSHCPKHGGAGVAIRDLLAEFDAVRAERDEAEARGRADERAKVVAWLRGQSHEQVNDSRWAALCEASNAIERGEHEVQP